MSFEEKLSIEKLKEIQDKLIEVLLKCDFQ